jgi:hypothetical protein
MAAMSAIRYMFATMVSPLRGWRNVAHELLAPPVVPSDDVPIALQTVCGTEPQRGVG